jgi:hypothetical protein
MTPTSRLYDALNTFLSQCQDTWKDIRHIETLCWMMIGMIQSQNVHLNGFGRMFSGGRFPRKHCWSMFRVGQPMRNLIRDGFDAGYPIDA